MKLKKMLLIPLFSFALVGNVYPAPNTHTKVREQVISRLSGEDKEKAEVFREIMQSGKSAKDRKNAEILLDTMVGIELFQQEKYADAVSFLKKGAENGDRIAMFALGYSYAQIKNGVKAMYWFDESCSKGYSQACDILNSLK